MTLQKILELFPAAKVNAADNTVVIGQLVLSIDRLEGDANAKK